MKAQIRMIIASVIVIALALTAVSGITYSWFSDTEQSDITITTGKIDLDAKYSDVQVKSYGDTTAKDVTLNNTTGTTTTLAGVVKATTSDTATDGAAGSQLAITFSGAAPGDEITFNMAVTLVNTIYVTYKQSIIMDSEAPFTITGFENKTLKGTAVGNDGLNSTSYYMLGTETSGAQVTIKFNESADVTSYGDKQYTIILAVQAIQMNVEPAEIAATKTISLGTASAETVLTVKSAENTADITVTLPTTTKASSGTASSVSVTAKALTAAEVKADTTMSAVTSEGSVLAGVEISKSVEIEPGVSGETQQYFKITMNVGTLSEAVQSALKVYHNTTELTTSANDDGEYYQYADGVITIYALSFSPFVVIDGSQAMIGTEKYATLSEAIGAVNNGTASGNEITLLKDTSYSEGLTISEDATLNLNGHSIVFTSDAGFSYEKSLSVIGTTAGSKVTAESGSVFGGSTTGSALYINGGTYEAKYNVISSGDYEDGEWSVTIDAGSFKTTETSDDDENSSVLLSIVNCELIINGGEFYNEYESCIYAIYSDVTINGGHFSVSSYVIDMVINVDVKITGGTFVGKSSDSQKVQMINFASGCNGTVTGGTFSVENGGQSAIMFFIGSDASVDISGGTFTLGDNTSLFDNTSGDRTKIFSGGKIVNQDPTTYVKDGCKATENPEGTWTISSDSSE